MQAEARLLHGVHPAHGPQDPRGARVRVRAGAAARRLRQGAPHPQREARLLPGNRVRLLRLFALVHSRYTRYGV